MPGEMSGPPATKPARIGDILQECGLVTHAQLEDGLRYSRDHGVRLGEALIRLGHLNDDKLTWALGVQFDLSYVDLDDGMIDWEFLARLPLDDLERVLLLPLVSIGETVHAVIADPTASGRNELLQRLFPDKRVIVQLASAREIRDVIEKAKRRSASAPSGDYATRIEEWLASLGEGRITRLLSLPSPGASELSDVFLDGAQSPDARIATAEIPAFLDPIMDHRNDFGWGIISFEGPGRGHAIRWVTWTTLRGRALGLESIPSQSRRFPNPVGITLIASPDPVAAKQSLLDAAPVDARAGITVAFEAHVDAHSARAFQSEITGSRKRLQLVSQTAGILRECRLIFEAQSADEVLWLASEPACGGLAMSAVLRTPVSSREDLIPLMPPHSGIILKFIERAGKD